MENLVLTQEWDKIFPQSDKVDHKKTTKAGKPLNKEKNVIVFGCKEIRTVITGKAIKAAGLRKKSSKV